MIGVDTGKIKAILYDTRNEKGVLYDVEVSKTKLDDPNQKVEDRRKVTLNGSDDHIPTDFVTSANNALKACEGLIKRYCPESVDSFDHILFTLNLQCSYARLNAEYSGQSASFSMALAVLSSFFGFAIGQGVAATGTIDEHGKIGSVNYIHAKLTPYIKDESKQTIRTFIIPNLYEMDQLKSSTVPNRIIEFKKIATNKRQSIIYCSTLLESLKYVTTQEDFERIVNELCQSRQQDYREKLLVDIFPIPLEKEIDNGIVGYDTYITIALTKKFVFLKESPLSEPEKEAPPSQSINTQRPNKTRRWIFFGFIMSLGLVGVLLFTINIHEEVRVGRFSGDSKDNIGEPVKIPKQDKKKVLTTEKREKRIPEMDDGIQKPENTTYSRDVMKTPLTSKERAKALKQNYVINITKAVRTDPRDGHIYFDIAFKGRETDAQPINVIAINLTREGGKLIPYILPGCETILKFDKKNEYKNVELGDSYNPCHLAGVGGKNPAEMVFLLYMFEGDFIKFKELADRYGYILNNYRDHGDIAYRASPLIRVNDDGEDVTKNVRAR